MAGDTGHVQVSSSETERHQGAGTGGSSPDSGWGREGRVDFEGPRTQDCGASSQDPKLRQRSELQML